MNFVALKLTNGNPTEFMYIEDNILPEGYDVVWDRVQWLQYISEVSPYVNNPVFRLTNSHESPVNIDYNIYGLHKKRTIVKGELVLVQYYQNYDVDTNEYSDLAISEHREFLRDPSTFLAYQRNQTINWYLTDDTIGATKTSVKYYSLTESIEEGITRRKNVIAEAKIYTLGALGLVAAQTLLLQLAAPISAFIDGATQFLRQAINNLPDSTMSPTHRANLINILVLI